MSTVARALASWAGSHSPTDEDLALADLALRDTLAVAVAGRSETAVRHAASLQEAGRWAVAAHILDFDDLHLESTTHISAICVPAALARGGGAHAYLAGAGVMARLGTALGWPHYTAGWHATCTAGAPAAAVAAGVALGLNTDQLATAMALAVPGAGGVQRAFGTDAKSLQVGFAVDAGIRAADLAAAGASADHTALDAWMSLVGGDPEAVDVTGPAVPGGLAVKLYPCCYAMQRPIASIAALDGTVVRPDQVRRVAVRTPRGTVTPLIHASPRTGLEGKFSLQYAVATALLDRHCGFDSFTDAAVNRAEAQELMRRVEVTLLDGGDGLLDGEFEAEIHTDEEVLRVREKFPLGSPTRPPGEDDLAHKLRECLADSDVEPGSLTWASGAATLRRAIPGITHLRHEAPRQEHQHA